MWRQNSERHWVIVYVLYQSYSSGQFFERNNSTVWGKLHQTILKLHARTHSEQVTETGVAHCMLCMNACRNDWMTMHVFASNDPWRILVPIQIETVHKSTTRISRQGIQGFLLGIIKTHPQIPNDLSSQGGDRWWNKQVLIWTQNKKCTWVSAPGCENWIKFGSAGNRGPLVRGKYCGLP